MPILQRKLRGRRASKSSTSHTKFDTKVYHASLSRQKGCCFMSGVWLPITDYSAKHKVSVSTLRRRIKADDIKYRFLEGKYLLLDEPVTTPAFHRPSLSDSIATENVATVSRHNPTHGSAQQQASHESAFGQMVSQQTQKQRTAEPATSIVTNGPALNNHPPTSELNLDGPILSAANRLLNELKKAYSQILQEKEEQILQLKEEVTDLKTLVRVLEGENDKLNSRLGSPYRPLDL